MKRGIYPKFTPEEVKVMHRLKRMGLNYREIAEKFGCNKGTIHYHLNRRKDDSGAGASGGRRA